MTGYQYAGNSPMMNNDPMGNLLRQDDDSRISGPNAFSAQNQASSDAWIYGGGGDGGGGGSGWGSTGFGGIPINNGPMGTVIYDINQGIGTLGNAVAAINYITGQRVGSVQNVASTDAASMALAAGGKPGSTMLQEVNINAFSSGNLPSWCGNGQQFVNSNSANQRGSVSISSSVWEMNRIAANFSVSGIKASGLQIIQVYSGNAGMSRKLGFVDGGINSPYGKQNGPAQPNAPYYLTPGEVASGVTWNGTSGTILFQDEQNGAYYNDISTFNVIVVAQNYNGTGVDRLLGGFTWGYNNMAQINGGQIIYSPTVSPAAIQIIQQDYPGYKFTK
ncbi:hypothetical protein G7092_06720 [Mucilaginibacter sp. HC2]|uniref:hypothetical protein n=1 Tax=Mucilaginibacter inviolabilis TaxID=2714892 RepID=UPI00140B146F|nr:hypothetical protein [Mucilaginibacter inviolabilis]NHA03477.1 hypothetical protein [Mucilaginibacter inviolabilis]